MKSSQVIQQLKKYQSRRRNRFLLRCQFARHSDNKQTQQHCCENDREALDQKLTDDSASHIVFNIGSATSKTAEPVTNPVVANITASDAAYSFVNEIWSKSDSAFTSFASVSNSQNTV